MEIMRPQCELPFVRAELYIHYLSSKSSNPRFVPQSLVTHLSLDGLGRRQVPVPVSLVLCDANVPSRSALLLLPWIEFISIRRERKQDYQTCKPRSQRETHGGRYVITSASDLRFHRWGESHQGGGGGPGLPSDIPGPVLPSTHRSPEMYAPLHKCSQSPHLDAREIPVRLLSPSTQLSTLCGWVASTSCQIPMSHASCALSMRVRQHIRVQWRTALATIPACSALFPAAIAEYLHAIMLDRYHPPGWVKKSRRPVGSTEEFGFAVPSM